MKKLLASIGFLVLAVLVLTIAFAQLEDRDLRSQSTWPQSLEEYLGKPAYKTIDPAKPIEEQAALFEIAEREFLMPTIFINSPLGAEMKIDGLNLIYVLPDYTSRADFQSRQEYDMAQDQRRFAHMLIEPSENRPSFDTMIENLKQSLAGVESVGKLGELEIEHWYRVRVRTHSQ